MGIYNSSGAFRVTENDTTGKGVYAADGSLRITVVDGLSFTGLYAADGSINVVTVTANETPAGLYDPCGALRGVTWTNEYGRPPNGAIYMDGLGGSVSQATLWWNGDIYDTTPDILIDYTDPVENDVITIERCADGNGFLTVTTWTHTVTAAEILASTITHDLGTWSAGAYDVRVKVADSLGSLKCDWSATLDVTIGASGSDIAAIYLMMEAA